MNANQIPAISEGGWFSDMPFRVETYAGCMLQCRSPHAGRVLVLDLRLFSYCIHEYTDPLSWQREWMYDNGDNHGNALTTCLTALVDWLDHPQRPEPNLWTRATDVVNDRPRIRRGRHQANGIWYFEDTTHDEP